MPHPAPSATSFVPVIPPSLRRLLRLVLFLFALLSVNSLYLGAVTLAEYLTGETLQNYVYLLMFLAHLGLGLILIIPALGFALMHLRRAISRPNRYAVGAGLGLFVSLLLLFVSGILLTRFGFFEINQPTVRAVAYWVHVIAPLAAAWLFVLHRLAGPRLRWRPAIAWTAAGLILTGGGLLLHLKQAAEPENLARPFEPALMQSADARIPPEHLMTDEACAECHQDIAKQIAGSVHRLSSFNNPVYRFSVEETRRVTMNRDGTVQPARLCATCHDPVPLTSGRFDDPHYDPDQDPGSQAGLTCLACHAIERVNSLRGNGDYTLSDPPVYPFARSDSPLLKAVHDQLIKAKPEFHKETLLRPVHKTAEFCSTCHKVHLPFALNQYRWLRGQNHYDSFLLSGVSGHRVDSFYYPPKAVANCAQCHMPLTPSDDPAARDFGGSGTRAVHSHFFPAANTGVAKLMNRPEAEIAERQQFLKQAVRLDLFGLREEGSIEGKLHAPLRPELPILQAGKRYLLETIIRTVRIGHELTQGTSDSNELWLDVTLRSGDRILGRSGGMDGEGAVDPWSWFVNAYVLDRDGNRIDRRNAQDIFVPLYNHQIPPGAAAVAHFAFNVPEGFSGPLTVEAKLQYRKFDNTLLRHMQKEGFKGNDLPITTMASDSVTLMVGDAALTPTPLPGGEGLPPAQTSPIEPWQRWNDYGIALFREGDQGSSKGELRQAAEAFEKVEAMGHADGPLNLARVYFKEGRLEEASTALGRAAGFTPPAPPWTVAWYGALVDRELGNLDKAVAALEWLAETRWADARARGFDFGKDFRMLNELGRTLYERARQERGDQRQTQRKQFLERAKIRLEQVFAIDSENAAAHYNMALVLAELGDVEGANRHRELHDKYRPDDQAIERAVTIARSKNPAANHAAEPIAIYDLQREGAFGMKVSGQNVEIARE